MNYSKFEPDASNFIPNFACKQIARPIIVYISNCFEQFVIIFFHQFVVVMSIRVKTAAWWMLQNRAVLCLVVQKWIWVYTLRMSRVTIFEEKSTGNSRFVNNVFTFWTIWIFESVIRMRIQTDTNNWTWNFCNCHVWHPLFINLNK